MFTSARPHKIPTMLPEIKLLISQNDKIIQTVSREVDTKNFVKTIEIFQEVANAALTNMIDEIGGSGDCIVEEDDDESDLDEDVDTNPKKRKK